MIFAAIAFVVGVAVGAFSHKYLAAQAAKVGIDPNAIADKVNSEIKKV